MLSRTADNLFWLARYIERSENVARLLDVGLRMASLTQEAGGDATEWRSTIVAAVSIPLSVLAAIILMSTTGITINIMTLGGLAVAVGRVVDDSIVVLENIYRHRSQGEPIGEAVLNGTREVSSAITSSTITTIAVFLPLGVVGGLISQFFLPFALTVTYALLASLVVALTVIPVLAYFLVKVKGSKATIPYAVDTDHEESALRSTRIVF